MKLTVHALEWEAEKAAMMAEFSKPLSKIDLEVLREDGFSAARGMAASSMKWVWLQWLLAAEVKGIQETVRAFVEKGLKMRSKSSLFYMRPHADLYLLHCAIFGSDQRQSLEVAEGAVDTSGLPGTDCRHFFSSGGYYWRWPWHRAPR